ncbi:hypothetical protein IAI10_16215 [Clostridium sp. 19966]|uniref:hypothetical protein n=1 Tax=Clostridium sp. 19966 TaxID=2768166 RepID=UPI0028DE0415|nr:hypothetical protein [Clostridium sp. 19966]MDT8718212.1 hypothetical protein [Clostridium sp. 19966]
MTEALRNKNHNLLNSKAELKLNGFSHIKALLDRNRALKSKLIKLEREKLELKDELFKARYENARLAEKSCPFNNACNEFKNQITQLIIDHREKNPLKK